MRSGRRVGIVGMGALGTSIGLGLRKAGVSALGYDTSRENLEHARRSGAVSVACGSPAAMSGCKVVFVAVPPRETAAAVRSVLSVTRAAVIDVASVKAAIVREVTHCRFVPSHPLAGTHLSGPQGARDGLFDGATWVFCPSPSTSRARLAAAEDVVRTLGARPLRMSAAEHDAAVASTSHLPHIAASGLVHALRRHDLSDMHRLVGGGFLDTTRIARANPELWTDIALSNREEIGRSVDWLIEKLTAVGRAIGDGDRDAVLDFFAAAQSLIETQILNPAAGTETTRVVSFSAPGPGPVAVELGGVR